MASGDPTIKVKVETDTSSAEKGLDKTASSAESFGSRFKSTFAGVLAANVVQNLAGKVFDFGKSSIEAYQAAEQRQAQFVDAMGRIPGASAKTTQALQDQAKALSQVTEYSAGASKQALITLSQYGLTGQQLGQLLPLVQDYAARTGQELPSAAQQVGKALLGQGRALKNVGIDFHNAGSVGANFAQVMTGLTDKVGGTAEMMGKTSGGQMKIFENQMTAMKVQIGGALVPALAAVMPVLQPLMQFIAQNAKWLAPMAAGIIAVAGAFIFLNFAVGLFMANPPVLLLLAIAAAVVAVVVGIVLLIKYWDTIVSAIMTGVNFIWGIMQTVWGAILGVIQTVWNWITSNWPLLLPILLGPVGIAAALIITYWSQIWNAALAVWSWIAGAWNAIYGWVTQPFIAAWQAIAGVWGAVVGWFGGLVGGIARAFSSVTGAITAPFSAAWSWLSSTVGQIAAWFAGVPGAIGAALAGVTAAITAPFKAAFDFINNNVIGPIRSGWNAVAGAINGLHIKLEIPSNPITDFMHLAGKGFEWSAPHIPTLARGGLMTSSGLVFAHAGEVISPAPARATNNGPLVHITNANFGERVDVDTFAKRLAWELGRGVA